LLLPGPKDLFDALEEELVLYQTNVSRLREFYTEAVMMTLGTTIGRQNAHEVVHHAAHIVATSNSGATFLEVLAADPRVNAHLSPAEIAKLLDPASHTGLSATIARDTSARAHAAAARHRPTPQSPTGSAD
jgi:adenylosuccinate lyase